MRGLRTRLAIFWFLYMVGLGIFFPYFSLYLKENLDLSGTQVGLVVAVMPLVGLFTQPLWGSLADRSGSRRLVLCLVAAGMAVGNLWLAFLDGFYTVLLGTAGLAIFSTVVLSMATAVSLGSVAHLGPHAFGHVRMWGTLGFLSAVVTFPRFLESTQDIVLFGLRWQGLERMFPITALFTGAAALMALLLPQVPALRLRSERGDLSRLLRHPPALRLLILVLAAHICLQGPINLFPLYISERGGDAAMIGSMWVFMLLLEIPLIGFSGTTLRRLGPRGLLTLGLVAEGIRWSVSAFATDLALVRAVQLLHGVGVAGIIIGAPLYLEQAVPERLRATGQSLISSAGFGAGAILSISLGGVLFDHYGATIPYALSGLGALTLGVLLFRILPEPYRPEEKTSRPTNAI